MSDGHAGEIHEIRDRPLGRPSGWFTSCACGWTSEESVRPSQVVAAYSKHLKTLAPTPKDT